MHEDKLIYNHFNIQFDENNVYYVSLIHDNFEYLKDASIKRYKDAFVEVYDFLYEIQSLYERGIVKIEDGKAVISNDDFMSLEDDERQKIFFSAPVDFSVTIRDRSIISYNDFQFKYKIMDERYKDAEIVGCFIVKNNNVNLMSTHLYKLFKSINFINNIPFEIPNREALILEHINKIKEESPFTHSTLNSFYKDEIIIIPSKMMIDFREDNQHNIEIDMNLVGLDDQEQICLKERYEKLIDIPSTYSFSTNGKNYRVVLSPEIKENLVTLKSMPRKIRRQNDKAALLKNPTATFKFPEVVSLENFSDRVIDIGLYQSVAMGNVEPSNIAWKFPIYRDIYTISGDKAELKISNKEELKELETLLFNALNEELPLIFYQDIEIPLSENNLDALRDFCSFKDPDEKEEDEKRKKSKKAFLKDVRGEVFSININDDLIESLKREIQDARKNKTKIENVEINGRIVPLTKENIKPLIKILEVHLIIDEDYQNLSDLHEELMSKYCEPLELPPDMKTHIKLNNGKVVPLSLKEHQKKGLNWLQNSYRMRDIGREGVLLADDMGLGKTFQILSFIFWLKEKYPQNFNSLNNKPILIVAPVILLENWRKEYHQFFESTLGEPLVLHGDILRSLRTDDGTYNGKEYYQITDESGAPKSYLDINKILESNIVITNYDTIVNYEYSLASISWSCIILDEAQEIKEEQSYKSRLLKGFKADFKIACTGTPVENRLTDLWNIFNFLQPDLLGTRKDFVKQYSDKSMTEEKYESLREKFFYKKPYAYILRRMKGIELKDSLTNKYIETHNVVMTKAEDEAYSSLKNEMLKSDTPIEVLLRMNKLSQHPRLINPTNTYDADSLINDSPKFQKLIEILNDIKSKNEKVIIFALFHEVQKYLKLVLEEKFDFENIDIINGSSSGTSTRQKQIDKFQEDPNNFNILILSPLAAGVGLNITGANHVIHYSRWWNPAKESQATDRAYRIGQIKDVYVHYLINKSLSSDPTFDENLHSLLTSKIELAENFLKPNNIELHDNLIKEIIKT